MKKDKSPIVSVTYSVFGNKILIHTRVGDSHMLETRKINDIEKKIKILETLIGKMKRDGKDVSFTL